MGTNKAQTVAVLNASEDVVELFRVLLEAEGYNTVGAHVPQFERGDADILEFMNKHNPEAIIYDVPPPYEQSWTFARMVMNLEVMKGRKIVFTTTNKARLEAVTGDISSFEIAQKPYDFQKVVEAVKKVLSEK